MNSSEFNKCTDCKKMYLLIYKGNELLNNVAYCDQCIQKRPLLSLKNFDKIWQEIKNEHE